MRKILALCLVLCMCFGLCGCELTLDLSFLGKEEFHEEEPSYEPVYEIPDKNEEITAYLSSKYEGPFTHSHYDTNQTTLYYQSEKYKPLIKVCDKEALWLAGYDISAYEDDYADNGYYAVSYNDAYQYYFDMISYIPDCTMLLEYSGDVLPSALTPDIPFLDAKTQYPEYFQPRIYILRTSTFTDNQIVQLKALLTANNEMVDVFIVVAERDRWSTATIEDIAKYPMVYNVRQYFSTIPEDSGV